MRRRHSPSAEPRLKTPRIQNLPEERIVRSVRSEGGPLGTGRMSYCCEATGAARFDPHRSGEGTGEFARNTVALGQLIAAADRDNKYVCARGVCVVGGGAWKALGVVYDEAKQLWIVADSGHGKVRVCGVDGVELPRLTVSGFVNPSAVSIHTMGTSFAVLDDDSIKIYHYVPCRSPIGYRVWVVAERLRGRCRALATTCTGNLFTMYRSHGHWEARLYSAQHSDQVLCSIPYSTSPDANPSFAHSSQHIIYLTDLGTNGIVYFHSNGDSLVETRRQSKEIGGGDELAYVSGVFAGCDGAMLVADAATHSLYAFDAAGVKKRKVVVPVREGGAFPYTAQIAITPDGRVAVTRRRGMGCQLYQLYLSSRPDGTKPVPIEETLRDIASTPSLPAAVLDPPPPPPDLSKLSAGEPIRATNLGDDHRIVDMCVESDEEEEKVDVKEKEDVEEEEEVQFIYETRRVKAELTAEAPDADSAYGSIDRPIILDSDSEEEREQGGGDDHHYGDQGDTMFLLEQEEQEQNMEKETGGKEIGSVEQQLSNERTNKQSVFECKKKEGIVEQAQEGGQRQEEQCLEQQSGDSNGKLFRFVYEEREEKQKEDQENWEVRNEEEESCRETNESERGVSRDQEQQIYASVTSLAYSLSSYIDLDDRVRSLSAVFPSIDIDPAAQKAGDALAEMTIEEGGV